MASFDLSSLITCRFHGGVVVNTLSGIVADNLPNILPIPIIVMQRFARRIDALGVVLSMNNVLLLVKC